MDSDGESIASFVNVPVPGGRAPRRRRPPREVDALGNEDMVVPDVKTHPFPRFAWCTELGLAMAADEREEAAAAADIAAVVAEGGDPEEKVAGSDLEAAMDSFEHLFLNAPGVGAGAAAAVMDLPLPPNTHADDSFCYLCATAQNPQNEYREKIIKMLELRDEMDLFCLCQLVANFYAHNLEAFVRRKWTAKGVERHLRECSNDVGYAISRDMRLLSAYDDEYAKFATRSNSDGEPIAPDHTHVLMHLRVIESRRKQVTLMLQYQRSRSKM